MSKERPILFNSEMVRAILDGRKTQTRRVMRRQPDAVERFKHGEETTDTDAQYAVLRCYNTPKFFKGCNSGWFADAKYKTPFNEFNVGDHLWVRETFAVVPESAYRHSQIVQTISPDDAEKAAIYKQNFNLSSSGLKWKPSIHMPRWAARILLEITKIRVERLNDISEADCLKEGIGSPLLRDCKKPKFMDLWKSVYGEAAWDENPWVWVVEFKVIEGATQ